jgi:Zn finger protein HypA/HybF involved in hydrogenase expression
MATKLKDIPNQKISIKCAVCRHIVIHEVANLILVVDEEMTTHDVRQRASCPKCKAVGDNTYSVA